MNNYPTPTYIEQYSIDALKIDLKRLKIPVLGVWPTNYEHEYQGCLLIITLSRPLSSLELEELDSGLNRGDDSVDITRITPLIYLITITE